MKYFNKINKFINKTPIYQAIEMGDIEILKLLLTNDKLNVNIPYIFMIIIFL